MEHSSELNSELFDMVKSGKLSPRKILNLIRLRNLVDSFVTKPYLEDDKKEKIYQEMGVYPDIVTWGDYFQTEVGSRHFDISDDEFEKLIDTIRFDFISTHMIFTDKPASFLDQIRGNALLTRSLDPECWTDKDKENIHLEILLEYFENLGIGKKPLSNSDKLWYESFDLSKVAI